MSRFLVLLVFLLIVVGGGLLLGTLFQPGAWYDALNKPSFTPPDIAFAFVWPVLYVLIATAGWLVFIRSVSGGAWTLWIVNLLLNFAFSPIMFNAHSLVWAAVVTFATLVTAVAFISATWHRERIAAFCFIPYALWLGYAFTLALTIWWINPAVAAG